MGARESSRRPRGRNGKRPRCYGETASWPAALAPMPCVAERALTSSTCARGRRARATASARTSERAAAATYASLRYARVHGSPSQVVHVCLAWHVGVVDKHLLALKALICPWECCNWESHRHFFFERKTVVAIHRCYNGNKEFWLPCPVHVCSLELEWHLEDPIDCKKLIMFFDSLSVTKLGSTAYY